jgi:hypothetical protein
MKSDNVLRPEMIERVAKAILDSTGRTISRGTVSGGYKNIQRGYYSINGKNMFFRSKWEANYSLYLNFLIKQKQITKWEYEPDTFVFDKIKFGTRSYTPDFKIYNGIIEYHEVKGHMTAKSKTQIKRMAKYYPEIRLIIIDADVYKDIKNKLGKMRL